MPRPARILIALLAIGSFVLAACGGDTPSGTEDAATDADAAPADGDMPLVVATTSILGDVVATLVGEDGRVEVLMPPGVDPHAYQPSASDAALLREADLVVANGLQLEESLLAALEAAEAEGVEIVTLAEQLDPLEFDGDGHAHEDDDEHGHEDDDEHGHEDDDEHGHEDDDEHGHDHELDPHVWLDPVRMADGVELLAADLAAAIPSVPAAEWTARGEAYADELRQVHEEIEARFADIPAERRLLVTNHDALGYLADRYGFEVVGTVIPGATTQVEADARRFAELVEVVEREQVPAVFAENTDSTTLAEQLRSEVVGRGDLELQVVQLYTDALGEPGSGAETYLGLLRTNAELIADALG
jgi:zinc/manganese transport system substrate-binding protein